MSTTLVALRRARLARPRGLARLADYVQLAKPKIATLVLVAVAASAFVAAGGPPNLVVLLHTLLGTALVAASASALNQWLERESDALMPRTANRPLPAGRLNSGEVFCFGLVTAVGGVCYLALLVNLTTTALGLATWIFYVWIYTPLKRKSWLNTVVGAVAGALPVLIGWASAAPVDLRAMALFMIVYLWQFPHFMAIAWIYRRQYASAGLQMLSVVDPSGRRAGRQAVVAGLLLAPVSMLPLLLDGARSFFPLAMLALTLGQFACAWSFAVRLDELSARRLLKASLVYLPLALLLLTLAPWR